MLFRSMKFDKLIKTAELNYDYNGEKMHYLINASYAEESLGVDIEDKIIDKYSMDVEGRTIQIKQYQVAGKKESRFSASFEEMGLEYFLTGTMEKSEFELIINNLYFL